MGAFLQNYGAGDEHRIRVIKRTVVAVVAACILAVAAYLYLKNFREEQLAKRFLSQLNSRQFDAAYQTWGCGDSHPCRDYDYQKFLEDWGPSKDANWKVTGVDGCQAGAIVIVASGKSEKTPLWVERGGSTLSFSPWDECQGKQWRFKQFFRRLFGG